MPKDWKNPLLLILAILFIDQTFKIWIKTHMYLGQEYVIFPNWFIIHFTENNGMAYGLEFGGEFGKIFLSIFRIVAIGGIVWYLNTLIKKKYPRGLIISISLILAGAIGNMIDSAFYGMIFSESYYQIATLFPKDGGYSSFLHGKVVDMLYFPIINTHYPMWFPRLDWLGSWFPKPGDPFIFFSPIFNISDSVITIGVAMIILFQKQYFSNNTKKELNNEAINPYTG